MVQQPDISVHKRLYKESMIWKSVQKEKEAEAMSIQQQQFTILWDHKITAHRYEEKLMNLDVEDLDYEKLKISVWDSTNSNL